MVRKSILGSLLHLFLRDPISPCIDVWYLDDGRCACYPNSLVLQTNSVLIWTSTIHSIWTTQFILKSTSSNTLTICLVLYVMVYVLAWVFFSVRYRQYYHNSNRSKCMDIYLYSALYWHAHAEDTEHYTSARYRILVTGPVAPFFLHFFFRSHILLWNTQK